MQSIIEAIFDRRSIRKYTEEKLTEEQIERLLKAGMYAPTARNSRAWHFYVIEKREQLDHLSEIHPYGKMLRYATSAILICGDNAIDDTLGYHAVNCAAATQNILLAAHEMRLGAVWLGVYPREQRMQEIASYLDVNAQHIPISLIALGNTTVEKERPERYEIEKITRL